MADTPVETIREEIKEFLKGADITSASSKMVRAHLNRQFNCDFIARKKEIDKIVLDVLTELEGDEKKDSDASAESESDAAADDDFEEDDKPKKTRGRKPAPKKAAAAKPKRKSKRSDSDEEDEESDDDYTERRAKKPRATNGNAKAPRKSAAGGGGDDGAKKPRKPTGYLKQLKLSPDLAAVMGQDHMARNEVVKKMYAVVKERDLYDPKNRQFAILDDQLQKVFGQKRVRMFGMLKHLSKHFSTAD